MAKAQDGSESTTATAEQKIEEFAEDLGTLLGNAKNKAEGWLGQRKYIAEHLTGIRDTAAGLLAQLGLGAGERPAARPQRGRPRTRAGAVATANPVPPAVTAPEARKPRTMSAEARARISAAQKKRWARMRKTQGR
jgi:hypothetical protein